MDLRSFIGSKKPIILDGGLGTEMIDRGVEPGGSVNINNPQVVMDILKDYIAVGSEIISTNTFIANRIYLETHYPDVDVEASNKAAVKIAREACPPGKYILGDIGGTGQLLKPYGDYTQEQFYNNYKEQAKLLLDGGVDGFIIETQTDLGEALCSLQAVRDITDLPIILSFAFSKTKKGFATMMGNTLEDCVKQGEEAGADVIGANCGDLDPAEIAEVVKEIKSITQLPIIAQPNAGKPKLVNGITKYDMSPEDFASGVKKSIEAGAHLVGGCCGAGPEHIRNLKELL